MAFVDGVLPVLAYFTELSRDIGALEASQDSVKNTIDDLKTDFDTVRTDIDKLKTDVAYVRGRLDGANDVDVEAVETVGFIDPNSWLLTDHSAPAPSPTQQFVAPDKVPVQ